MNKWRARSSSRVLSVGLILALLVLVSGLASAQSRDISSSVFELAKLTASDGAEWDAFGMSVAVSGDTVVVGAYFDDDHGEDSGSAYLFERDEEAAGNWGRVAKLTASDGAAGDRFGWSVSISGDTVIAGAHDDDNDNGDRSGAAYVFEKPESGWTNMTETAKLTASDGAALDLLGWSVSISGGTVVVGALCDDDNGDLSGSAYLFEMPEGGWVDMTETAKLTASDGTSNAYLGWSVSISGDTAVAGAKGAMYDYVYGGSAYLFEMPETGWVDMTETVRLMSSDLDHDDIFGSSVSISGDTTVIGAPGDDDSGYGSGSAYLFGRNAGGPENWGQVAKLTASDAAGQDQFGYSVSISGDIAVASAIFDDDSGDASGSAHLFEKPEAAWVDMTETAKLTASDGAEDDFFGHSVSISGNTLVAGAPGTDDYGENSGSAYLFLHFKPITWVYLPVVLRSAPE